MVTRVIKKNSKKKLSAKFITANFLLRGVGMKPALEGQTIPATAYMIFQAMFAALTPGNTIDKILDLAIKFFVCYTQLLLLDLQLSVCL